jgi:hypothetical protein
LGSSYLAPSKQLRPHLAARSPDLRAQKVPYRILQSVWSHRWGENYESGVRQQGHTKRVRPSGTPTLFRNLASISQRFLAVLETRTGGTILDRMPMDI